MLSQESLLREVVRDSFGLPVADIRNGGVHGAVLPIGRQRACAQLQVRGQQREEAQHLVVKGLLVSSTVGDGDSWRG